MGGFPIWIGTVPSGGEAPRAGWEPAPPGCKGAHPEENDPHLVWVRRYLVLPAGKRLQRRERHVHIPRRVVGGDLEADFLIPLGNDGELEAGGEDSVLPQVLDQGIGP